MKKYIILIGIVILCLVNKNIRSQDQPKIIVTSPQNHGKLNQPTCYIEGNVIDEEGVISITFGRISVGVSGKNVPFKYPFQLKEGKNEILIEAMNTKGNINNFELVVFYEKEILKELEVETLKEEQIKEVEEKSEKVEEKSERIVILPIKEVEEKKEVKIVKKKIVEKSERTVALPKKISKPKKRKIEKRIVGFPKVFLGDKKIQCNKASPRIVNKRTMIPSEDEYINLLNITVKKEEINNKQVIIFTYRNKEVKVVQNEKKIIVNEIEKEIDVAPYLHNSITMIPLRAVFEELGFTVHWDKDNYRVIIFISTTTASSTIG